MKDNKKFGSAEEEAFELNDEELEGIAGGIEIPPPCVPPVPIGDGHPGEQSANCPLFSTRNT